MLTIVCFLWFDKNRKHNDLFTYDAECVNRLASMLSRHLTLPYELVCCTNIPEGIDKSVRIVPLPSEAVELGSLYPKLLFWHPDAAEIFGGKRLLLMDIDVVILGNIDGILDRDEPFVAWETARKTAERFNTSLVLLDAGYHRQVWDKFSTRQIAVHTDLGYHGKDQGWASFVLKNEGPSWPRRGAGIETWGEIKDIGPPENCRLVFFNGLSSPGMAKCKVPWVVKNWR